MTAKSDVPGCRAAGKQVESVLASQINALPQSARAGATKRMQTMSPVTRQRCEQDGWSQGTITCLAAAATEAEQKVCSLRFRADQYRRWFRQLLRATVPGPATADEKIGPSCLQIQVHYSTLLPATKPQPNANTAPPGPRARARAWVPRILFERCIADNWPSSARSCFANATVADAGCEKRLPKPARTALGDHLRDMAEHLGIAH